MAKMLSKTNLTKASLNTAQTSTRNTNGCKGSIVLTDYAVHGINNEKISHYDTRALYLAKKGEGFRHFQKSTEPSRTNDRQKAAVVELQAQQFMKNEFVKPEHEGAQCGLTNCALSQQDSSGGIGTRRGHGPFIVSWA